MGSLTIFAIIDCAETLATVCHPSLFHKLIASGFSSCCVGLIQSFLYDRCAGVVCQNQTSCYFEVRRGVLPCPQDFSCISASC